MLLVFDIGNTNTVMGIFDGDKLVGHWRLTSRKRTADEVGFMIQGMLSSFGIDKGAIDGAIFGSVVPPLDEMIRGGVRKYIGIECLRVTAKLNTGLTIKMKNPTGIGADRIVNAVAAREKYGAPLIVVDFGTALNFEVLDARPAYVGGVITPGLPLMTRYLHEKTALLPEVSLGGETPAIGKSTEEAIALGARVGYRGIVRELVGHLRRPLGEGARVVATGGYAGWVLDGAGLDYVIDPTLTLFGLGRIFENGGSD